MKDHSPSITPESQEISLDKWGMQLMENILLTAAEALGERKPENLDSTEVTLTFRLTPIPSKNALEVRVEFKRDPTVITYIPRQFLSAI